MNLIQESYQRLFPNKEFLYQTYLEYNRRLSSFNANITLHRNLIKVHLNLQWKDIDEEIKIGLIQHLLGKILKNKKNTPNIELYHNFIKNIHILTPKKENEPYLDHSFNRINELFFQNEMEKPNIKWGTDSRRKLACYNFHDDTVTISTLFKDAPTHILDYLMYHELLHKHFKFNHKNGRSSYHSPDFKRAELQYPNMKEVEKEINGLLRSKKPRKIWDYFKP